MPMANLYAYLLERKLVTPLFLRPRKGPSPGFDPSKKCEHHFGAEGHTLEECFQLRDCVKDLLDNKLIQFNNATALNIITLASPSGRECECHYHSERKGSEYLLAIIRGIFGHVIVFYFSLFFV